MTEFDVNINGIDVHAKYTQDSIDNIFLPLIEILRKIQKEKQRRILVLLAAPPGTGKSTLAEFLSYLSGQENGKEQIKSIGMDGFHCYQKYLENHKMIRNGRELLMSDIKGAPETFDVVRLRNQIERVAKGENCGWPVYDRMKHDPQENTITVEGNIILLEGNYLLLNREEWKEIQKFADYTIKITAEGDSLRDRLISRKSKSGMSFEEAEKFVEFSDMYNVKTCLNESINANFEIYMDNIGNYHKRNDRV